MGRPTCVLLSLALGLFHIQTPDDLAFPNETPAQAIEGLASLGYAFVRTMDSDISGKLTAKGMRFNATFYAPPPLRKDDPPSPLKEIFLSVELGFPQEIPLDPEAYAWPSDPSKPRFVPYLGKTAFASVTIDLTKGATRGRVRADLDRFWRETAAYVRDHGGRFAPTIVTDWRKVRFSDDYVLKVADETSLDRATTSWGWEHRKSPGGSTAGWIFPIDVDGVRLDVFQGAGISEPAVPDTFFHVGSSVVLPDGVDAKRWIETEGRLQSWADFSSGIGGMDTVYPTLAFDLRKGVPLGEIRRRIKSFAVRLAAFRKANEARKGLRPPES